MHSDRPAKVTKTADEWKSQLTPEQYRVTRQHGTEPAFSNPLNREKRAGVFSCVGCGAPLFSSSTKFDSGTGWPSFWAPGRERRSDRARGPFLADAPGRGSLRHLRCASRPRLSRRTKAHRRTLLHERGRAQFHAGCAGEDVRRPTGDAERRSPTV
jgi:hypothetical protein